MGKGIILLFLDKQFYIGGEQVTGRVELDLFEACPANGLLIKWKGFEKTMIERTVDNDTIIYREEETFFKQIMVLAKIDGREMMPGRYDFPFQFILPSSLPGIFWDERVEWDGDHIRAAIVYKVKVWLDMPGKEIKVHEHINVLEQMIAVPEPIHVHKEKSFLLSKSSKKMKITVDIDKNIFFPGEIIQVHVNVENESNKEVQKLKVKLKREVTVRADGVTAHHTNEMNRQEYEGLHKRSSKTVVLPFQLDMNAYPSTHGKLVTCKYHLDVECDVPRFPDLEVHPAITLAMLPQVGQPMTLYNTYVPF